MTHTRFLLKILSLRHHGVKLFWTKVGVFPPMPLLLGLTCNEDICQTTTYSLIYCTYILLLYKDNPPQWHFLGDHLSLQFHHIAFCDGSLYHSYTVIKAFGGLVSGYTTCYSWDHYQQGWASILFKRTDRSLRSFPFFIKERNTLWVLFRSL